jgi:hypothetical protein
MKDFERSMRAFKTITVGAAIVMCLLAAEFFSQAQTKIAETTFSYVVPAGWSVRNVQGMKYKSAFGKRSAGFSPNIIVIDERYSGPLEKYVSGNEATLRMVLPGYKRVSRIPFVTAAKIQGIKLVALQSEKAKKARLVFYFFGNKSGWKFVVTCTALASDGAKYDRAFNAAMKTFTLK